MRSQTEPIVVSVLGAAVFVVAAAAVYGEAGPVGFDALWLMATETARKPWATDLMLAATQIGRGPVTVVTTTALACWLVVRGDRRAALFMAIANVGSLFWTNLMKHSFGRVRPELIDRITDPQSFSFPSGHALSAMVFWTSLAMLVHWRFAKWRIPTAALAAFMIATIGASRVYLGVHYPSDVLGGFGLGAAWVWGVYAFFTRRYCQS